MGRKIKTFISILLLAALMLLLVSCSSSNTANNERVSQSNMQMVASPLMLRTDMTKMKSGYSTKSLSNETPEPIATYREAELIQLLKGATLLASGGGGSYALGQEILNSFKMQNPDVPIEVSIYDVDAMDDNDSTFGVAMMGSPSSHAPVSDLSRIALLSYNETLELAERYGKNPEYTLALEMGGANTLIPLLCAMKYNLKVLDADLCGRAVPGLETSLSAINGLPTAPFALVDAEGNSYDINMVDPTDAGGVEEVALAILNQLESTGAFTGFFYSGDEVLENIPTGSLTRCVEIGRCIERFEAMSISERAAHPLFEMLNELEFPIECVTLTRKASPVQNFHQESTAGGARDVGHYYLGVEGEVGNYFYLQFDNETMAVSVLNEQGGFDCIATAPCMIAMYDQNTGLPLTNADLKNYFLEGEGSAPNGMLGIIKNDSKWWKSATAVSDAWTPYLLESGHTGGVVRYPFD